MAGDTRASPSSLTVAVCARNAQHCIGECLASIQKQTVPPDEVIVAVDDLSDPTVEVAEKHGARVIATHATGLYEARNAVLDACTTDYLAFTDADCVLIPEWVERAKNVLDTHPEIAAGTGRHPPIGRRNLASWLHHMWFVVETAQTGEYRDVIGGNSYFRTEALRAVGGWLKLPGHSAAEDMYISRALRRVGYRVWFEESLIAYHHYESRLIGLWRKAVMMGRDIVVMMRAAEWRDSLWWYTLAIPLLALMLPVGLALATVRVWAGLAIAAFPLVVTFAFLAARFRSVRKAFPRWVARWVVIWPYSWGILKGMCTLIPKQARR